MATKPTAAARAKSGRKEGSVPGERTRIAELRRDEIMAAAVDVFHRDGFRGASLDDVAAGVGVSKSLIYYHFENKAELLAEMYARMGSIFFDEVVPILENSELDFEERLRRAIEVHVTVAIGNQALFEIYFRERHEVSKEARDRLVGIRERNYVDRLRVLLEEGGEAGVFDPRDPMVAAFAVVGACNWITFWYRAEPKVAAGRRVLGAKEIAEIIYHTVGEGLVTR